MDVLKSRKTNCLHCCCDFIWYINNATFPITFAQVGFRFQQLIIRNIILIKFTTILKTNFQSISPNFFWIEVSCLVSCTCHQTFSNFFLEIMHLNHYQDVQLMELRMTFCNIHLEYLKADFLCLFALNKVFVLFLIYFVYLQLIWSSFTTFHGNFQYYAACFNKDPLMLLLSSFSVIYQFSHFITK